MCLQLCEDAPDDYTSCEDCGRMICWDVKNGDDIIRPAFVTSSGDLYCDWCGRKHEAAEEADESEDAYIDFDDEDELCET